MDDGPQNSHHEHIIVLSAAGLIFSVHKLIFSACTTAAASFGGLTIASKLMVVVIL